MMQADMQYWGTSNLGRHEDIEESRVLDELEHTSFAPVFRILLEDEDDVSSGYVGDTEVYDRDP